MCILNYYPTSAVREVREAAIVLYGPFFIITGLAALVLALSVLSLGIAVWLGIADAAGVTSVRLPPWLIAAAIAFSTVKNWIVDPDKRNRFQIDRCEQPSLPVPRRG